MLNLLYCLPPENNKTISYISTEKYILDNVESFCISDPLKIKESFCIFLLESRFWKMFNLLYSLPPENNKIVLHIYILLLESRLWKKLNLLYCFPPESSSVYRF